MKTLTITTRYGNCAQPAVNHRRDGISEQPPKGTLFVPALFEPVFTPSREAHYIREKGNIEEFGALKKCNLSFPRFLSENDLFRRKTLKEAVKAKTSKSD